MGQPPVTVTIPAYRQNEALEAAIESVENQEYAGDIEIIVVDSSETKVAEPLVADYPDVTYHWQLTHVPRRETGMANLAVARDLGIWFAEGDYVHLLDHDDELAPTAIAKKVDLVETREDIGGAYSTVLKHDGSIGNIPSRVIGNELRFALVYLRSPALPSTLLVRRDILQDCPPRSRLPHEDLSGLVEILLRTNLGYVDEPLTVRNEAPNLARDLDSQRGLLETHEFYAGLRNQLLTPEQRRESERQFQKIKDRIRNLESESSG